jgi:L-amino acid N-acyltransferase YncA
LNVRPVNVARDAAGCAAIYRPFVERTAASFEDRPPSDGEFAARINQITQTHAWLVADDGGRLLGFAYGCPHRERAAYRWAADVAVYVDPRHHRRGIGKTLYQALIERLQKQRICVLCAGIALPNDASVALHESLGFGLTGVYRKIGYKLGRWHDVGWWQLALGPQTDDPPPEPGAPSA